MALTIQQELRFDLNENSLSTYDTSIEKSTPDARVGHAILLPKSLLRAFFSLLAGGFPFDGLSRQPQIRKMNTSIRTMSECRGQCSSSSIIQSLLLPFGETSSCRRRLNDRLILNACVILSTLKSKTFGSARRLGSFPPTVRRRLGNKGLPARIWPLSGSTQVFVSCNEILLPCCRDHASYHAYSRCGFHLAELLHKACLEHYCIHHVEI